MVLAEAGGKPDERDRPRAPLLSRFGAQIRRSCRAPLARRHEQCRPPGRLAIPARYDVAGHGQRRAAHRRIRLAVPVGARPLLPFCRLLQLPRLAISADHCRGLVPGRSAARRLRLLPDLGPDAADLQPRPRADGLGRHLRSDGADGLHHEDVGGLFTPAVRHLVRRRPASAVRPAPGDGEADPALGARRRAWSAAPSSSAAARRPKC